MYCYLFDYESRAMFNWVGPEFRLWVLGLLDEWIYLKESDMSYAALLLLLQ